MKRYRLYIDESGDHTYSQLYDPTYRYLGLIGVAIEQEYYRTEFHPKLENLKQVHFPHDPDSPVILVRQEIIGRKGIFGRLADANKNAQWEKDFLDFLNKAQVTLFSVVIDKKDHLGRYGGAAYHPYHYCMTVLIERLRGFLHFSGGRADVMAESRGWRNEDKKLQRAYEDIWNDGTFFIPSGEEFQKILTSKEIKFRTKKHNIAGLQLADLIAAPSKLDILVEHKRILPTTLSKFTMKINQEIGQKYNRYGRNFLD